MTVNQAAVSPLISHQWRPRVNLQHDHRMSENPDGGSQQGNGETASQPGHDTAIGLVLFGGEEGSESFVGGGRSCAQTTSERDD